MKGFGVALALVLVGIAGCVDDGRTPPTASPADDDVIADHPVRCRLVDARGDPLRSGACTFATSAETRQLPVDDDGAAVWMVREGTTLLLEGLAPRHWTKSVQLVIDAPKSVELTLEPRQQEQQGQPGEGEDEENPTPATPDPSGDIEDPPPVVIPQKRTWSRPTTVTSNGNEPHLVVAPDGTIYYAPTSALWRSTDGGRTFENISPGLGEALPTLGSDTSVSVAPDGSVWFSRYWGYAMGTIGCTSTDRGDSWTCDDLALPGVTDRMWIVGLDGDRGYLQTNEGLYHHVWAETITGSVKYTPYAVGTSILAVRNGNMIYDETRDRVWQIEWSGGTQRLLRIDGQAGVISNQDTGIPNTYALPWLAARDGVYWTTGEPRDGDGSRSLLLARSTDGGGSWTSFPIQSAAQSITFSYAAAGPDGRVAAVYYGSDAPGPSTDNGGTWSLYVVESDNGLDRHPTWIETRLVHGIHQGNVCIGLSCEDTGDDPEARFSGDLIGAWIDDDGNIHVAYNDDSSGDTLNQYIRQRLG